jgi:hypothetical protein
MAFGVGGDGDLAGDTAQRELLGAQGSCVDTLIAN